MAVGYVVGLFICGWIGSPWLCVAWFAGYPIIGCFFHE